MLILRAAKALVLLAGFVIGAALAPPAQADPVMIQDGPLSGELGLPIYQWQDPSQAPKSIIVAIHGLTMHGTVFDECARKLAAQGAVVVAIDLPGYGARNKRTKPSRFNYADTEKDLCAVTAAARRHFAGLPVFVAGESLGGSIAIRLAARHPELVDGLILSAPAIRMYHSVPRRTLTDAAIAMYKPAHELDLSGYIKNDFSNDARITSEAMQDPMIRKRLRLDEVLRTCELVSTTERYIKKIPPHVAVLVLQGEKDLMVRRVSVKVLEEKLRTPNKSICVLPERGHILMETSHVQPETIGVISSWLNSQCAQFESERSL
jgi:acylglycerol lipase